MYVNTIANSAFYNVMGKQVFQWHLFPLREWKGGREVKRNVDVTETPLLFAFLTCPNWGRGSNLQPIIVMCPSPEIEPEIL